MAVIDLHSFPTYRLVIRQDQLFAFT